MSKIGKKPIPIPDGVKFGMKRNVVSVSGPKGELSREIHPEFDVKIKDGNLFVFPKRESRFLQPYYGLTRALIANMVEGVSKGFTKVLRLVGVGYRAKMKDSAIELSLGFSHPVIFQPPEGVKIEVPEPQRIVVTGIDKEVVGDSASKIRSFKPPEPYKGKGVRYEGEYVRRKPGKRAVSTGI